MPTITPTRYALELRDKDGNLKGRLEPFVTNLSWEWNRAGGCGRCTFTISGSYLRNVIEADDDFRIYLTDSGGTTATLWYRGYVESATPSASGNESIQVECSGYFGMMERFIVQDDGDELEYLGTEVSAIAEDLVDTFVVPNTDITTGTFQASSVSPDQIAFKGSVKEALDTLADLVGSPEYGVDEDLSFFWYNESDTYKHRFYLGGDVTKISKKTDYKNILNQIYFEGGDVDGAAFKTSGGSSQSQAKFGVHQGIVSNGSINTSATASQFIRGLLNQKGVPQRQFSVGVTNTTKRLESSLPISAVAVVDPEDYQDLLKYGTTGAGGSNTLYGKKVNGGSNKRYGSTARNQVDRIKYTVSDMDGRVDAEIQFGNSLSVSRASASLKRLENTLNAVRQRSL